MDANTKLFEKYLGSYKQRKKEISVGEFGHTDVIGASITSNVIQARFEESIIVLKTIPVLRNPKQVLEQNENLWKLFESENKNQHILPLKKVYTLEKIKGKLGIHINLVYQKMNYSLQQLVQKQLMTEKQVMMLLKQIIWVLDYLKKFNIIHGNIKPSNVFFNDNGLSKISDISLYEFLRDPETGEDIFTFETEYLAPEIVKQLKDSQDSFSPDSKGDIYSLGLTMLYALYKYGKFQYFNSISQGEKHNPQVKQLIDKIQNPQLKMALSGMLMYRKEQRASLNQIYNDLELASNQKDIGNNIFVGLEDNNSKTDIISSANTVNNTSSLKQIAQSCELELKNLVTKEEKQQGKLHRDLEKQLAKFKQSFLENFEQKFGELENNFSQQKKKQISLLKSNPNFKSGSVSIMETTRSDYKECIDDIQQELKTFFYENLGNFNKTFVTIIEDAYIKDKKMRYLQNQRKSQASGNNFGDNPSFNHINLNSYNTINSIQGSTFKNSTLISQTKFQQKKKTINEINKQKMEKVLQQIDTLSKIEKQEYQSQFLISKNNLIYMCYLLKKKKVTQFDNMYELAKIEQLYNQHESQIKFIECVQMHDKSGFLIISIGEDNILKLWKHSYSKQKDLMKMITKMNEQPHDYQHIYKLCDNYQEFLQQLGEIQVKFSDSYKIDQLIYLNPQVILIRGGNILFLVKLSDDLSFTEDGISELENVKYVINYQRENSFMVIQEDKHKQSVLCIYDTNLKIMDICKYTQKHKLNVISNQINKVEQHSFNNEKQLLILSGDQGYISVCVFDNVESLSMLIHPQLLPKLHDTRITGIQYIDKIETMFSSDLDGKILKQKFNILEGKENKYSIEVKDYQFIDHLPYLNMIRSFLSVDNNLKEFLCLNMDGVNLFHEGNLTKQIIDPQKKLNFCLKSEKVIEDIRTEENNINQENEFFFQKDNQNQYNNNKNKNNSNINQNNQEFNIVIHKQDKKEDSGGENSEYIFINLEQDSQDNRTNLICPLIENQYFRSQDREKKKRQLKGKKGCIIF